MKIHIFIFFLVIILITNASAQQIALFEVNIGTNQSNLAVPMQINLDPLTFLPEDELVFYLLDGKTKQSIPFQVKSAETRTLHWLLIPNQKKLTYILEKGKKTKSHQELAIAKTEGKLIVKAGTKNLLNYQYETLYPPKGVDTIFKRNAFIHPLLSPHGQELTRIQPPDHYHHYGIWNPWTRVLFEGDTVDFWNLYDKKGTVRFANFTSQSSGQIFSEFEAVHQHIVFKKDKKEKIALNETQKITVFQPSDNYYIMDITSKITCASEIPVLLLTYRYGGLGWRTTGFWDNKNSEVMTSEGKNRKEADGSTAKWCIVQGALPENDYGGVLLLSYPTNYNHPEPLRVWPENQYDRGDLFVNFSPTKNKDWNLEVGKTYILKYRLVVFNGKFESQKAEIVWQNFTNPPKVLFK